jgi:hypothetical protein
MSFLHGFLLTGLVATLIPILIHFSGRRQPKTHLFPTLQFVHATRVASARGWSVKRWLLLFLRVGLIALAVLAIASPRVHQASFASWISMGLLIILGVFALIVSAFAFARRASSAIKYTSLFVGVALLTSVAAWSGYTFFRGPVAPMQSNSGPVAAVVILDNSPTMGYRFENETRFAKAKEFAKWIVGRLDKQSMIAVLTGAYGERLQLGQTQADTIIERLELSGRPIDIPSRIRKAIDLVRASKLERHEIYIVTDMSAASWLSDEASLQSMIADGEPILLQVVDVGTSDHSNWSIDAVKISQDVAPVGTTVQVDVQVKAAAKTSAQQIVLELLAELPNAGSPKIVDGKLQPPPSKLIDRKIAESQGTGETTPFNFQIPNLPLGVANYQLKLSSADPLPTDDTYEFTLEGVNSGDTLVLDANKKGTSIAFNEQGLSVQAELVSLMMNPAAEPTSVISVDSINARELADLAVIALVNPPLDLPAATVEKLSNFVQTGGGLVLILGDAIDAKKLQDETATTLSTLLPGKIERLTRRSDEELYLENIDVSNGIWSEFGNEVKSIPWARYPVYKHWDIDELGPNAKAIARYTISGLPAVIDDVRGEGHIVTFTTPIADLDTKTHVPWNTLTTSPDSWPVFGMMLGTNRYLQSIGDKRRNFNVGDTAFVQFVEKPTTNRYELFHADGSSEQVAIDGDSFLYGFTHAAGHYRLRGMGANAKDTRGFAVHRPIGATTLDRIDDVELDKQLGKDNYVLARDQQSLQQSIGQGRYGRDLAPFLFLVVAGIFLAEQAMSQNYYAQQNAKGKARRS